ncbi:HAD family hydrolase [Gordonia jinghuaiqii]|uniref:HAD family hydrolase n=1 Tax=Gordonia jinghuaiqii TaxID=2758710 RepID=UPI002948BC5C|nr:HAD-IB family phosphatase [Gordonia jinghuaiqii]
MASDARNDAPLTGRRLHVFDMDGTLLRGAATIELARHFGQLTRGLDIEARWLEDKITEREFWEVLLDICGDADPADLDAAFRAAPWMAGITETFADIRARGEVAIVISQSPVFFVRRLETWGAHETYGSALEIGQGFDDGATLSPEAKVEITRDVLSRLDLGPNECVAYGDSSSDVELFGWLPHTVAVNASPVISDMAAVSYHGTDIGEAYALGQRLATARIQQM